MPSKTFPAVVSFDKTAAKSTDHTLVPSTSEETDYAKSIAEAVDVQEIDVNLYMSKELWLPPGARGAFGGQVGLLLFLGFHNNSPMPTLLFHCLNVLSLIIKFKI